MLVLHRSRMGNTSGEGILYILWTSAHGPRNNSEERKQKETNRTLWKREILTGVREPVEERISPMIRELKTR